MQLVIYYNEQSKCCNCTVHPNNGSIVSSLLSLRNAGYDKKGFMFDLVSKLKNELIYTPP